MALSSLRPDKTRLMFWRDVEAQEVVNAIILHGSVLSRDFVDNVTASSALIVIVAKDHGMSSSHQ